MLRYIFTLATLLNSKSKIRKHYSPDIIISDLFDENLDEIDFVKSLSELEMIYGFEIPGEFLIKDKKNIGKRNNTITKTLIDKVGLKEVENLWIQYGCYKAAEKLSELLEQTISLSTIAT